MQKKAASYKMNSEKTSHALAVTHESPHLQRTVNIHTQVCWKAGGRPPSTSQWLSPQSGTLKWFFFHVCSFDFLSFGYCPPPPVY